jgi:hypothetical protein
MAGAAELFFETGEPLDGQCSGFKHDDDYKITPAMRAELDRRLPEFSKLWKESGATLLPATVDLIGRPYGRTEEEITLTLCQWLSPMSNPLMLRVREYLKSTSVDNPNGPRDLKPSAYFVGQVFHELIHRYLDRHFPRIDQPDQSAMVKSHASEPGGVLTHLHLLSVQKAVYLKLNRGKELETIIAWDKKLGGNYKRAWELVESDGYQKYIDELTKP